MRCRFFAGLMLVVGCGGDGGSTPDDGGSGGVGVAPAQGTQGGACFADGACSAGLSCNAGVCQASAGSGGTSGTSGTQPDGATDECPGELSAVQLSVVRGPYCGDRVCGREPVCDLYCGTCPNDAECDDDGACLYPCEDTLSDQFNCGACGRECAGGKSSECIDGECAPSSAYTCVQEDDGFTTCDEICASVGHACVPAACGTDEHTVTPCSNGPEFRSSDPCSAPLVWPDTSTGLRCCCDTIP